MPVSKHRAKQISQEKKRAYQLYKQGISITEVRNILEKAGLKRSRAWVGFAVQELSK